MDDKTQALLPRIVINKIYWDKASAIRRDVVVLDPPKIGVFGLPNTVLALDNSGYDNLMLDLQRLNPFKMCPIPKPSLPEQFPRMPTLHCDFTINSFQPIS